MIFSLRRLQEEQTLRTTDFKQRGVTAGLSIDAGDPYSVRGTITNPAQFAAQMLFGCRPFKTFKSVQIQELRDHSFLDRRPSKSQNYPPLVDSIQRYEPQGT